MFALSLSNTGSQFVREIKLFDAVNLTNATDVVPTAGMSANYSAYTFGPATKDLIVNQSVSASFASQAFIIKDFTVKGYLKTSSENLMAIISFVDSDKAKKSLFNVLFSFVPESSYKKVQFRVEYLSHFGSEELIKSDSIELGKASKNVWLFFTVRVHIQEKLIRFGIDNNYFKHSDDKTKLFRTFSTDGVLRVAQLTLLGNENIPQIAHRFLGDLQDVSIHFGDLSCDEAPPGPTVIPDTKAPVVTPKACPTQSTPVSQCIGKMDGKTYTNGENWKEGLCVTCYCEVVNHAVRTYCMQFCKVCTHAGKYYRDGDEWESSSCEKCSCKDGAVSCKSTPKKRKDGCDLTCAETTCKTKKVGCYCPGDEVLRNGKCEIRLSCPCTDGGNQYKPGYVKVDGCFFCKCSGGKYSCVNFC